MRERLDTAASLVANWPFVLSLAILIVNDNLLKGADNFPSLVSGKLSDFVGLFMFPLLLLGLLSLLGWNVGRRSVIVAVATVVAIVFGAVQLKTAAGGVYVEALSVVRTPVEAIRDLATGDQMQWSRPNLVHVMAPWDLVALPATVASALYAWQRAKLGAISQFSARRNRPIDRDGIGPSAVWPEC